MPFNSDRYLNNTEDTIASQKRIERDGSGVYGAAVLAGSVAAFVLLRRKIALTRLFSKQIKSIGQAGEGLSKHILRAEMDTTKPFLSKIADVTRNWWEASKKALPTAREQYGLAVSRYQQYESTLSRGASRLNLSMMPTVEEAGISGWNTFLKGPAVAAIAPRATMGIPGRNLTSGGYGGIAIGKNFYRIGAKGDTRKVFKNIELNIPAIGGRMEELRLGLVEHGKGYRTTEEFIEKALIPRGTLQEESRRMVAEKYLKGLGVTRVGSSIKEMLPIEDATYKQVIETFSKIKEQRPDLSHIITPGKLFKKEAGAIQTSYKKALETLVAQEIKKPTVNAAYKAYRAQVGIGIGEMYARHGAGGWPVVSPKWWTKHIGKALESGYKHPTTGRFMPTQARVYAKPGLRPSTVAGMWSRGVKGEFYATQAGRRVQRALLSISEGTFYRAGEEILGLGITTRRNVATDFISNLLKAHPQSWTGYAVRRHFGMARLVGYGFGAYHTFRFVNYLARQATGGWGVTDVAGKMYTSGRELQQNLLNQVGAVNTFREIEKAFPGTIKSPVSHAMRMTAPVWMAAAGSHGVGPSKGLELFGKKIIPGFKAFGFKGAGRKGGLIGLALGIATALITWGDITQSPEELHKIFTGEQDVPIRKGRYWPFGKTPFFGGKAMYWRPHWYPMMRSRYRHSGDLWESETEEMAQGTPFSPILAPFLQGRMWDPYYWEKKHYADRPYPMTGELFEPTMPFAWLGNMTIGQLVKPQKPMHREYWGTPQEEPADRGIIPFAAGSLGMRPLAPEGMLPTVTPDSTNWNAGMAMYTLTEQMGLRGFMLQQFAEGLTGRPDFLPEGPVVESSRKATGYEREYWGLNIGDPGGFTELFRRVLPHRRKQIETWNPIRNLMPEWLPGSKHYIDFLHGDPYTKVEMGEARLPGRGYEALHELHSGIPEVYDAVDRFLILSDIAPYSDQYKHYKSLARMMVRKDDKWSETVKSHIAQRAATQREYDFLELEPPDDVARPLRGLSKAYRHGIASITNQAGMLEILPLAPISKLFPYKTAVGTYKDYRIHGSDFTSWGHPVRDFVAPWARKVAGSGADMFGFEYISEGEKVRRDYEDYFDKLKYVKNIKLSNLADTQGNNSLAGQYRALAGKTMTGLNVQGGWANIYSAMPKRERSFFDAFTAAEGSDREEILDMVPKPMERLYKAQWNIMDRKEGRDKSYNVEDTQARDLVDYFKDNHMPEDTWAGWHPDVDLRDVQLKVVKNEGMDIHDFNLWQSQERQMRRRSYVPTIENIHSPTGDMAELQKILYAQLQNEGFRNSKIYMNRTPASKDSVRINFNIKRNRKRQYQKSMRSMSYA